jgi:CHAT domain-containing protein
LSACSTATTESERLPDEVIGLPAGVLQAGVPGVVGSLWTTDDLATLLLMVRFWKLYRTGGPEGERLEPASALARAQRWLRDLTAQELREWARRYRQVSLRGHPLAAIAAGIAARFATALPDEKPFEEPTVWAPFIFLGT